ncbi:ABC transporter substrate-binding protein [Paracoccus siganidrum]|uniref:ABC transporter substrate-binding protein n=2 Tax=Paracoccus siganidrum TaxID=1276757 RepID=A0A419ABD9_9RHOB|nr:ABC transporter substrate-binding protein [Paracoccus siganidrum]RJL20760.1 ABC transporter substrate-binding protein [Paracoccus siganidrum]RMC31931.1 peptide ABC transporter substrate-binding protein [Paracoccus siganidrum]
MTTSCTRRSLLLAAGAFSMGAAMGLRPLPSSAQQTPRRGGTFRLAIPDFDSADTLDPQLNETRFMMALQYQLRNCLIEVGPRGELVPELATEWDTNADLTEWTFKLRQGVEFHNAKTMTAEDVVFSLNLHRGPNTISEIKSLMAIVTDITATTADEVRVTLAAPNAGFASLMSLSNLLIVPADDREFGKGIGTGGYTLESYEPGIGSRTVRFPNYWKEGRAHFDEAETRCIADVNARTTALQTGQIDAMGGVDTATAMLLSAMPGINLLQTKGKQHYAFSVDCKDPRFADTNVRMALKLAIDRQEMLDKILSGYGSIANDQPLSDAYPFHHPELPQHAYDPDQARALLRKAGAEGLVIPLHVAETPFSGATDMAQLYAEQASQAGITVEIRREPDDGYWSNVWGKRPMFATNWTGRISEDVMLTLAYSRESIGSWNETNWDNDAFNTALTAARGEKDEQKRKELYWECQSLIAEDGGMIAPLWADFLDAVSDKIGHGELARDWELDGVRAAERWWFTA